MIASQVCDCDRQLTLGKCTCSELHLAVEFESDLKMLRRFGAALLLLGAARALRPRPAAAALAPRQLPNRVYFVSWLAFANNVGKGIGGGQPVKRKEEAEKYDVEADGVIFDSYIEAKEFYSSHP